MICRGENIFKGLGKIKLHSLSYNAYLIFAISPCPHVCHVGVSCELLPAEVAGADIVHRQENVLRVPELLQVSLHINIDRAALLQDDNMLAENIGHSESWCSKDISNVI